MTEQVPFWWVVLALLVTQVVTLAAVGLSQHLQAKREHERWLLERRAEAIEVALNHAWEVFRAGAVADVNPVRSNVARLCTYGLYNVADVYVGVVEDAVEATNPQEGRDRLGPLITIATEALGIAEPSTDKKN